MRLIPRFAGSLRVWVTSADGGGLLEKLRLRGISIWEIQPEENLEIRFSVHHRDYPVVKEICEKRGDRLRIDGKTGLYWAGRRLLRRPVLMAGLALLLFGMIWLPGHIYFVKVEGNIRVPTRQILEAAERNGIGFGVSRREIRSEAVKNGLLEALPQLQWAGVNTYGCVAVISVREKSLAEEEEKEGGISSIVAACDGIVRSATATDGTLLCQVGQAVRAGETLISGYTDCGLTIQATRAQGEVYGWTQHEITACTPKKYDQRGEAIRKSTSYSLILGKNRINLWKGSGISGTSCDRIYETCTLTLPGGFALPVTLVKETVTDYEVTPVEALPQLPTGEFAQTYLLTQLIAGTVEHRQETDLSTGDAQIVKVQFFCTEMIGRQKEEEIGDIHG